MKTAKMTIRLPENERAFAKHYASENGFSLTGLIHRYLTRLLQAKSSDIPLEVGSVEGIVPPRVDAKAEYAERALRQHR